MARMPRIVFPQYPCHIVQRGNRRMDVFFTDEDRLKYLVLCASQWVVRSVLGERI